MNIEDDMCVVAAALEGKQELKRFENILQRVIDLEQQQEIDADRIQQLETTIKFLNALKKAAS